MSRAAGCTDTGGEGSPVRAVVRATVARLFEAGGGDDREKCEGRVGGAQAENHLVARVEGRCDLVGVDVFVVARGEYGAGGRGGGGGTGGARWPLRILLAASSL